MLCHITFSDRSMPIYPYPNLYPNIYQSCRSVLLAEWLVPWIDLLSSHFFSCNGNKLKGSTELERPRINVFLLFFFFYSLRVRGQHTKTTGRKGRTVGVAKKKN